MRIFRGFSSFAEESPGVDGILVRKARRGEAAMTLAEIAIGLAVLGLVVATSLTCLTILNKNALSGRIMTSAREVVQSNIEQTIGAPFSSTNTPALLTVGTTTTTVPLYQNRDGTGTLPATLTRTVTSINSTVRGITVHLDYTLKGRPLSYEMTTMRAMDK